MKEGLYLLDNIESLDISENYIEDMALFRSFTEWMFNLI